ncbi:MAG TPA: hypothetical protein VGR21_00405 [Cryptosporangiaceae bacterium]|nr:hypothetical protein [Cryptosporangiaceae bacterium]
MSNRPVRLTVRTCIVAAVAVTLLLTPTAYASRRLDADRLPVPAAPLAAPVLDASTVVADTVAEHRAILAYWTPGRMRTAVPAMPSVRRPRTGGVPGLAGLVPSIRDVGPPRPAPVAKPEPRARQALPRAEGGGYAWPGGGAVARTTGRVFFTLQGTDYVCSGSAVRSLNRDTVATAGHCVNAGPGEYATAWMFVPGYRDGSSPYGRWTARRLFAPTSWTRDGVIDSDVGFAVVNTRDGRHLTDVVGAQAIGFNAGRGRYARLFGYPATGGYDGARMYYCQGTPRQDRYGTRNQGVRCDMTEGASGGPWLTGFDPDTGTGTVTSVSSFGYSDDPNVMWGPYFGDTARAVFRRAQAA